ncbi:MAG: hypothetical protein WCP77_12680 [Roseococcus sp.]
MLSARPPSAEIDLAAAVIHRALEDALTPDNRLARPRVIATPTGPRHGFTAGLKPRDREEAVRFLLDTAPGWASSREAWCDSADIDPDVIRRQALRRIPHGSIPADICRALRLPMPPGMTEANAPAAEEAPPTAQIAEAA